MRTFTTNRPANQYRGGLLTWGILIALFGLCALLWPHLTLITMIYLFGVFALFNGILGIYTAYHERATSSTWGVPMAAGVISLLFGLAVLFWPHATAAIVLYLIATWAIITGVFQLAGAFSRGHRQSTLFLGISGAASILLGIILFVVSPVAALLSLVWIVGLYALIYGGMQVMRSLFTPSRQIEQREYREPEFLP